MPKTHHGLEMMPCLSALQKAIRRGQAPVAMQFACELMHTSKAFFTAVCNRLEIVSHEDVGVRMAIQFTATCVEQAKRHYSADKIGPARLMIGNAIRFLCKSEKTRAGTYFAAAIGLENLNEPEVPRIPDYAYDVHTREGRRMGRGIDHFLSDGAKLVNPITPTVQDRIYEKRAVTQWKKKYAGILPAKSPQLDLKALAQKNGD
jgi:replication-associated recombination protein RarA